MAGKRGDWKRSRTQAWFHAIKLGKQYLSIAVPYLVGEASLSIKMALGLPPNTIDPRIFAILFLLEIFGKIEWGVFPKGCSRLFNIVLQPDVAIASEVSNFVRIPLR